MARLQIKVLHDEGDASNAPLMFTVDGKEVKMAQGDSQVVVVTQGLGLTLKAVTEAGVPLGNVASPSAEPGMSRTDPRQPAAAAPSGTHHEPSSPPNVAVPGKAKPAGAQPSAEEKRNAGAVNPT